MTQPASPEVDPAAICKLDGVELAVFPDDPHGCYMRVVFYDISLITFAKRHVSLNPRFSGMPLRPLEIAGLLISMPTISGQILTELMFGLDILIIIRK